MASLNQEGSACQLPPSKRSEKKNMLEDGKSSSTEKQKKPAPPERPPLPSCLVKSSGWQHASKQQFQAKFTTSQRQQLKQQTPFTMCTVSQTSQTGTQPPDSDRFSSTSDAPDEIQQAKEAENVCSVVTKGISEVNTTDLPSQDDGKGLEKDASSCSVVKPPKPAPRHSLEHTDEKEATTVGIAVNVSIQGGKRANTDVRDSGSEVNKSSTIAVESPGKVLFHPGESVRGSLLKRQAVNKNTGERRKTVPCHETAHGGTGSSSAIAALHKKLIDGAKGDKPTPPQKPDIVKRHFSMRTPKELEESAKAINLCNPTLDVSKNSLLENFKKTDTSPSAPTVPSAKCISLNTEKHSAAPPKPPVPSIPFKKPDLTQRRSKSKDSEVVTLRNTLNAWHSEPASHSSPQFLAAPPPKPPRTHAHDDYLKVQNDVSQTFDAKPSSDTPYQATASKSVHILDASLGGGETLKDTKNPSVMQQPNSLASSAPLNSSPKSITKEGTTICNPPPSRPPPPKKKSNLDDHMVRPSSLSHSQSEYPTAHKGGAVIFSVSPHFHTFLGKQSSDVPELHSRHPTDKFPLKDFDKSSQRLPLHKSFSSECLYSSQGSSIYDRLDDDGISAMSRSSCESQYEAVIDPDGYAVPHAFMHLPGRRDTSVQDENTSLFPNKYLTRNRGSSVKTIPAKNVSALEDGFTSIQEQNLNKVNKKTMIMVRQKISQAYADVNAVPARLSDRSDSDRESVEHGSDKEELVMESTVLKKRIEYCASVRRRSSGNIKRTKEYLSAIYPQLFEYCLVVGLRQLVCEDGYEPFVMHKFPENVSCNLSVPSFCFPDAAIFKPGSITSLSESYSFVMTSSDGSRVYGYCRRIQPPDASLPEVVCIVSPVDAFNMYNTLLNEIEARRRISFDLASELIAASFGRPLPKPGKVCHIRTLDISGDMETIVLNRPSDTRLENVNYESPLHYLGTDKLVIVFSSMLMERRIILYSSNLSVLTQTVHALCALLYPFHWQHVYVPLLPGEMLDTVCAPMPFIVGVQSSFLSRVQEMDLEEVLIVDLDKKMIVKSQGDESTILPKRIQKALKTAINMWKIDAEARKSQWLVVAEAFLRMFIETVGHFTNHICTQQDGNRIFQKEGFILEVVSTELREFLEWFTETQMFEVFIMNHVDNSDSGTSDLFLQRLTELKESKEESSRQKGLGAKVKNFGKALKTKLQAS